MTRELAKEKWFLSVLTPPGQGSDVPLVMGALCPSCAKKVYPPEVLKIAEKQRDKLLT